MKNFRVIISVAFISKVNLGYGYNPLYFTYLKLTLEINATNFITLKLEVGEGQVSPHLLLNGKASFFMVAVTS